jgi:hypothetical protein
MICNLCSSKNTLFIDTDDIEFEYQLRGQMMTVRKKNLTYNYVCLDCDNQYMAKKKLTKKECLMVDVDFGYWEIKNFKRIKNGCWFHIHKENSISYFCKAWGTYLTDTFEDKDFHGGLLFSAELRTEVMKKDGNIGTPFMVLNFNEESVNQTDLSLIKGDLS